MKSIIMPVPEQLDETKDHPDSYREFNDDLVGNISCINSRTYFCDLQSLGMANTYFTFCLYIIR